MADATSAITQGALRGIFDGSVQVDHPVLQCVQIKPMESKAGDGERYRIVLSDIKNFIQTMLATQANSLVTEGKLKKGSIIKLISFTPQVVKGKRILILLGLEVLEEFGELEKLGQPEALDPKLEPQEQKQQPAAISSSGFYGNKPVQQQQQHQHQQQPVKREMPSHPHNQGGGASHANLYPIEALSPYSHKWTIKARCIQKSPIKTWKNKNSEGKLFSVTLADETGEIRATGFNDQVDQLYELFQEGNAYYISAPCSVKIAKKQFTTVKNDYELTFERDTVVEKCDDESGVPQIRFNFTPIGELEAVEKDTTIEIIGILKEVGEISEIVSKSSGKPFQKRELTLVDDTLRSVRLTIWGATAQSFDAPLDSVIAFKGVKVSDFNGRSLSLLSSGSMYVDPDIDEAYKLKGWYDASGRNDNFVGQTNAGGMSAGSGGKQDYKTIQAVRDEELGISDQAQYFNLKATVIYVKQDNFCYPACQSEGCNKKVVEESAGEWRCEKCEKTWPRPQYRYIMSINVSDHTGQFWLTCFDDSGRIVMGMSADKLMEMKENGDDVAVTEAFAEAICKTYSFRVRAKMDTFQDNQRVRYTVQTCQPLDFARESAKLAEILKQYSLNDNSLFV